MVPPRLTQDIGPLIEEILNEGEIADQRTLLAKLESRGIRLAQPTLSRRLDRLGIRKIHGRYRKVATDEPQALLPPYHVVTCPPNLLLVRTEAGFAQALALRIDRLAIAGILGTVAGDDTIFVAVDDPDLTKISQRLLQALESPRSHPDREGSSGSMPRA